MRVIEQESSKARLSSTSEGDSDGIIESCSPLVVQVFAAPVAVGCTAIVSEPEALVFGALEVHQEAVIWAKLTGP
jgi:hypothetical protein